MQSWLRTHAAMVFPLMAAGILAFTRQSGISWREAGLHAEAMLAGFRIVRAMGNELRPTTLVWLMRSPRVVVALLLWLMLR